MDITILVDDVKSWFMPYAEKLKKQLEDSELNVELIHDQSIARGGDICFLLSCSKIAGKDFLNRYQHNIVVHASDLPEGKGFTPLKWEILRGKNEITLTMFEATEKLDSGPYYQKEKLYFDGTELLDELHEIMAEKIVIMCMAYVMDPDSFVAVEQKGKESFFPRFTKEDDRLDIDKTIRQQFNRLRIADNERFPIWFSFKNERYYLKIYKESRMD